MTRPIHVLELRSVRGTGGGPEKTIMLGAAQSDPAKVRVTVCYIRDERDAVFRLDQRAADLGIDYLEVLERHSFDRRIWGRLRALVRDRRIDIVHAHEYKTNFLALLLAEREPVVPLSTVHGWTGHSSRERHLYYPADRFLLRRYPRLIAVSGQIKRQLVDSGAAADRVSVVLNGIDHRKFRRDPSRETAGRAALGFAPEHTVIGAVGRLEPQKRFGLLIEAFADLLPSFPAARLVIAGDGSLMTQLRAQAAASLPPGTWSLPGHTDDVGLLHHGIDLYVQASDYEGTPNTVLEAMAFETPIVATDAGGTRELAHDGEHALIVPEVSRAALVRTIGQALQSPRAARERATAARRRVEHELSFATRMRTVESIYAELAIPTKAPVKRSGFLQWA
jgi:glycosyltransferase involved in cell wall biosynthesis